MVHCLGWFFSWSTYQCHFFSFNKHQNTWASCLADHPRTCKWLITMVIVSPLNGLIPLINGRTSWLVNRGDPQQLIYVRPGMIQKIVFAFLQKGPWSSFGRWDDATKSRRVPGSQYGWRTTCRGGGVAREGSLGDTENLGIFPPPQKNHRPPKT